jgi:hypothetical protein
MIENMDDPDYASGPTKYKQSAGGVKAGGYSKNGTWTNNEIYNNEGAAGLWFDVNALNMVIKYNKFYNNLRAGGFDEYQTQGSVWAYNLFYDNGLTPKNEWCNRGLALKIDLAWDMKVYNNVFQGNAKGIGIAHRSSPLTCAPPSTNQITVKNNIFLNNLVSDIDISQDAMDYRSMMPIVSDYNIFYNSSRTQIGRAPSACVLASRLEQPANLTLTQWQDVLGANSNDMNSRFVDPQVTDEANKNFTLSSKSPAINFGVIIGEIRDFINTLVPQGSAPDAGSYEYISAPPSDTTSPAVSITSPTNGQTVSGTITVSASASDNVAVSGVQFKLDGANLGAEDTTSPYSISWNTTTATNGSHTLTATARDAAGNQTTSSVINIIVSNNAVSVNKTEAESYTSKNSNLWIQSGAGEL